jgi:hypothetical protein
MSDNREYRSRRFAQLVGLELKGEFAKHSISQTKVAEILGHSKGGYSKWINAKPSMPLEAFLNTCELIEADPKAVIDASYKRLLDELGTPDEYRERQNQITNDLVEPRFEDLPPQELAASRDMNRNLEAETPDE